MVIWKPERYYVSSLCQWPAAKSGSQNATMYPACVSGPQPNLEARTLLCIQLVSVARSQICTLFM